MSIQFTNFNAINNDQTLGIQPDASDSPNTPDTDIALSGLDAGFFARLSTYGDVGAGSFADLTGGAKQASVVTVSASEGGALTSIGFSGLDGSPLPTYDMSYFDADPLNGTFSDGGQTDLTTINGDEIRLFLDTDTAGGLGDQLVLGATSDGTVVFAVWMFQTPNADGSVTVGMEMVTFDALTHLDPGDHDDEIDLNDFLSISVAEELTFDFNDLPSGQNLFGIVGDLNEQLIIMPENPNLDGDNEFTNISQTTNTSKGGGPVTIGNSNQMIDPGEGFFFYYVTGTNPSYIAGQPNGLDQNEADDADNVQTNQPGADTIDVDAAFFDVVQTQGNGTAAVDIRAYYLAEADGTPVDQTPFVDLVDVDEGPVLGTGGTNGTMVAITRVQVFDLNGGTPMLLADSDGVIGGGIAIAISGTGVASVSGLDAGMRVKYFTGTDLHNLSQVSGTGGKFDIGQFGINKPDGESEPVGDYVIWDDDGPTADLAPVAGGITVDESVRDLGGDTNFDDGAPLANVTVNVTDLYTNDSYYGTDGGDAETYSLFLSSEGADSGLVATVAGLPILLYTEAGSGDIVGLVGGPAGAEAFRISVVNNDPPTADTISVIQSLAVVHDDTGNPDDVANMNSGLVFLKLEVEDDDGDTDDDMEELGDRINFEDDGPRITADGDQPTLVTDDDDILVPASDTQSFAGTFDASDVGSDGPDAGGLTYALGVKGPDTDSGLDDSLTGQDIVLNLVGDNVVGTLAVTGETAFTISVVESGANAGDVTIERVRSVVHDDPGDPDEEGAAAEQMSAADLVTLTATVKDGDLDSASATADIALAFLFYDDGPAVEIVANLDAELSVDETILPASNSILPTGLDGYLSTNSADAGKDGEQSDVWSFSAPTVVGGDSGLVETATGEAVILALVGDDIVGSTSAGEVVRWTIDAATGEVSITQSSAVVHDDPTDPDESNGDGIDGTLDDPEMLNAGSILVTRTVVDKDGDSADSTTDISAIFKLEDDGPTAALATTDAVITLDETANDGDEGTAPGALADVTTAISLLFDDTSTFGTDGEFDSDGPGGADPDGVEYSLVLVGGPGPVASGLTDTFTDSSVDLYFINATTIQGWVGGPPGVGVLSLEIIVTNDPDEVRAIQYRAVKHDDPGDPDEADSPEFIDPGTVLLKVTVKDGDEDTDFATAELGSRINIEDDGPAEGGSQVVVVEEDDIDAQGGNDNDGPDGAGDGSGTRDVAVFVITPANLVVSGVDLPVKYGLNEAGLADMAAVLSQGDVVTWRLDGNKVEGVTNAGTGDEKVVIDFTLVDNGDSTATATIQIHHQLDHHDAGAVENTVLLLDGGGTTDTVDFTPILHITDGDDDPIMLTPGFLEVEDIDDSPEIAGVGNANDPGVVTFMAGQSVGHDLNGSVGTDHNDAGLNINGLYTYTFDPVTPFVIQDTSIAGLTGTVSADGTEIEFRDGEGTLYFDIVLGDQEGSGDYLFTVYQNAPEVFTQFDFEDLPSGQNLHGTIAVDKSDPDTDGLLLFPKGAIIHDPGDGTFTNASPTTNTSKGGGPVTIGNTNQMFDPGEGHYFIYVTDPQPASIAGVGLNQNNADDADTVKFNGTSEQMTAQVEIVQVQGNKPVEINITAFDIDPGNVDTDAESRALITDPTTLLEDSDTSEVGFQQPFITSVKIYSTAALDADPMAAPLFEATRGGAPSAKIIFNGDGSVNVKDLAANRTVEFTTDDPHDMALVTNVTGKYDIGGFNLSSLNETPDQLIDFNVDMHDFDGDMAETSFSVLIDGTGRFADGIYDQDPDPLV